jgi:hypothetical protein
LSTGANSAFAATGGGTVSVTGSTNTLAATTGTALNVANTTIGASGLTFRSINVDGNDVSPTNGIILNNTGSNGGLSVTGTGVAGSGGTIRDTSGDGISLTSTERFTIDGMNITSNLGNGIGGTTVNGFDLDQVSITDNGDSAADDDSGIDLVNLTGSAAAGTRPTRITNSTISNNWEFELQITNSAGTLTDLQMSGNSISSDGFQPNHGNLVNFLAGGASTANMTLNVTSGTFTGNTDISGGRIITATGVQCDHSGGSGTVTCNISGADFINNNVGPQGSISNGGSVVANFTDITATGNRSHGINFFTAANSTASLKAKVTNSVVGTLGTAGSGSSLGFGIRLQNEAVSTAADVRLQVTGTTVQETSSFALINVNQGIVGQTSSAASNVTLTNNTLRNSGARAIIVQQNNNTDADSAGNTCVDIAGNSMSNIAGQAGDLTDIRLRRLDANSAVGDSFKVKQLNLADLAAQNSLTTGDISIGGTMTYNEGNCPQP